MLAVPHADVTELAEVLATPGLDGKHPIAFDLESALTDGVADLTL